MLRARRFWVLVSAGSGLSVDVLHVLPAPAWFFPATLVFFHMLVRLIGDSKIGHEFE